MTFLVLGLKLMVIIVAGNIIYYYSGVLKKLGMSDIEEINASELSISEEGVLEEEFPDELLTEKETKVINILSNTLFVMTGSILWIFMGVSVGRVSYLLQPSDLMKLILYFFIYFLLLRLPFGITNKRIEKTYEIKLMPQKLAFSILMIAGFIIGINFYGNLPGFLQWLN